MAQAIPAPACKYLVLDAGPLLSLSPLRGLAENYVTVPQVLSELKDKNAREHFERLGLSAGVKIDVREPDALSLAQVVQFAKKTGDYGVLSHADLCVLALTLALDTQEKAAKAKEAADASTYGANAEVDVSKLEAVSGPEAEEAAAELIHAGSEEKGEAAEVTADNKSHEDAQSEADGDVGEQVSEEDEEDMEEQEPLDVTVEPVPDAQDERNPLTDQQPASQKSEAGVNRTPVFEDPSDSDDGEGEWITPDNVGMYKSQALDLLPSSSSSSDPFTVVKKKGKRRGQHRNASGAVENGPREQIGAGCMTADFAMQNVLLQMGLSLVGLEGKRIEKVKSWVLRCHACFKICKDSTKKFCPTCGNPTLLRTSVTASSPTADGSTPALEVHLKKNFVYKTRGTIYSIPRPKPGTSKTGSGEGLILREDQSEYMRAQKREEGRRAREERALVQSALAAAKTAGEGGASTGLRMGGWMDPDWVPEMLSVGMSGKGRRGGDGNARVPLGADGMPVIGYGRKNPNERRRKK